MSTRRHYSRTTEAHRDLKLDAARPVRGLDVRALQTATRRRLGARGIARDLPVDGELGPKTAEAVRTALRYLGAQEATYRLAGGQITVGAQRMVRYPGRRTAAQLELAEDRLEALERERADRAREAARTVGGGLTAREAMDARARAVGAMRLLYSHRGEVHYTQGPRRWDGIRHELNAREGQFPRYADCSSSVSWALWCGLHVPYGVADVVNGEGWGGGYTGTILRHGRGVGLGERKPADLVVYGRPGSTGAHVAMVAEDTRYVYSHGSEAGPFYVPVRYRTDVMAVRRFI